MKCVVMFASVLLVLGSAAGARADLQPYASVRVIDTSSSEAIAAQTFTLANGDRAVAIRIRLPAIPDVRWSLEQSAKNALAIDAVAQGSVRLLLHRVTDRAAWLSYLEGQRDALDAGPAFAGALFGLVPPKNEWLLLPRERPRDVGTYRAQHRLMHGEGVEELIGYVRLLHGAKGELFVLECRAQATKNPALGVLLDAACRSLAVAWREDAGGRAAGRPN